jgi:GTP-binding protein
MKRPTLFSTSCEFVAGAMEPHQLPKPSRPEVAFAGRSNVGKSSLINMVTGRKGMARASSAPGRTRQINFFLIANKLMLVDLPGYGYAKAPRGEIERWNMLVGAYLSGRRNLKRVFLLIDARRGVGDADRDMMELLEGAGLGYQLVLTKADKLAKDALEQVKQAAEQEALNRPGALPGVMVTSSHEGEGAQALRKLVTEAI